MWVHPRHICHTVFPGRLEHTTPHQDHYPVRGAVDTWTTWVPFGDCDTQLGGVAVAAGSHTRGMLPADEKTDSVAIDAGADEDWRWSPMAAGDVLMFHNTTADRIRLAGSFRYQRVSEPVDAAALNPHLRVLEWADVYAGWPASDPLRYYWRSLPLEIQPLWFANRNQHAGSK